MNQPRRNGKDSLLRRVNIFSGLTFWWVTSLIKKGYKSERLHHEDLFNLHPEEDTTRLWAKLDREWKKELRKKKYGRSPSFVLALARAFGFYYAMAAFPIFVEDAVRLSQPILFRVLIEYFMPDSTVSTEEAYLYASVIGVGIMLQAFAGPNIVFKLTYSGLQWQGATCALLYRKTLRLSNQARKQTTTGHIIDLVSHDAEKLDWVIWHLHNVWQLPLRVIVASVYIYYETENVLFVALGVVAMFLPVQWILAKLHAGFREKTYKAMDERINAMSEIISGMRVIKMYCWEKPFGRIIDQLRKREMGFQWSSRKCSTLIHQLSMFSFRFVTAIVVVTYVTLYGPLSAARIFPMFTFFDNICDSLLNELAWFTQTWLDVGVSVRRIEAFLQLEEKVDSAGLVYTAQCSINQPPAVVAKQLTASWDKDSTQATLYNISFDVRQGELLMIVGHVGCGKSSLLSSILGELPITSGDVHCTGKVAYAAQQPWVFSSTIRRNILFGAPYDPAKYAKAISAAALVKDLDSLPHGDLSLVGEKGVTLSGGQKARIGLARALYSDADVYLLDDPLSAVDAVVGREMFDKCINGVLRNKVRLLVTHQLQYLNGADRILVLNKGKIDHYGSYQDLVRSGADFAHLVSAETQDESSSKRQRLLSTDKPEDLIEDPDEIFLKRQISKEMEIHEEEDRETGGVDWRVFRDYFHAGNTWLGVAIAFLLCITTQLSYNLCDWWLALWSNAQSRPASMTSTGTDATVETSMLDDTFLAGSVYFAIVFFCFFEALLRSYCFFRMTTKSSTALHDMMYHSVTRSPIRFFDTNPKGRIINRFSSDISAVDGNVPNIALEFTEISLSLVGNLLVICVLNPVVLLGCIPVGVLLLLVRTPYVRTQRECQRLGTAAHSPVLTHLNASLEGLDTIRAFSAQSRCTRDFDEHYNFSSGVWFTEQVVFGWFQFRNNFVSGLFSVFIVFACLGQQSLNAGQIGLTMSYIISMMWRLETSSRVSAEVEIEMVKAERVLRYTRLPSEAELQSKTPPPITWPGDGTIVLDNVSFAYHADGPLVLKDINCRINAGEKIGIVGRTGAGKSSLIQALFRMAEHYGQIRIDGVPISELGLHDLRRNISIIPQDPVMFSGTVRKNLDPFGEHEDEAIWWALGEVELREVVRSLSLGLESPVSEGGSNFSAGQKQLFCLARALLRNNKILLLDEATANVDKQTDVLIQATIREKFDYCTVLTIAHRLNTIMDSDRVMVIEKGMVLEFDEPVNLLKDTAGSFYKMVEKTGPAEQYRLMRYAMDANRENVRETRTMHAQGGAPHVNSQRYWTSITRNTVK